MACLPRRLTVGSDLALRIPALEDAESLFDVIDADRSRLREWLRWVDGVRSVDDTRREVTRGLRRTDEGTAVHYIIERDGRIAGMLGVHRLDSPHSLAEISFWLAADMQGSGIMSRCCRVVVDYLFSRCGKNRVEISTGATNRRSRALAERLGFTLEGILRQATHLRGGYLDTAIYSVLAAEWRTQDAFRPQEPESR